MKEDADEQLINHFAFAHFSGQTRTQYNISISLYSMLRPRTIQSLGKAP